MIEKFNWLGEKYSIPSPLSKAFDYFVRVIKEENKSSDIALFNTRFKKYKL